MIVQITVSDACRKQHFLATGTDAGTIVLADFPTEQLTEQERGILWGLPFGASTNDRSSNTRR